MPDSHPKPYSPRVMPYSTGVQPYTPRVATYSSGVVPHVPVAAPRSDTPLSAKEPRHAALPTEDPLTYHPTVAPLLPLVRKYKPPIRPYVAYKASQIKSLPDVDAAVAPQRIVTERRHTAPPLIPSKPRLSWTGRIRAFMSPAVKRFARAVNRLVAKAASVFRKV